MNTTATLVSELATLRVTVAAHRARVIDACEARTEAMEAAGVPVVYGRYDLDTKDEWRYPSVAEATRAYEALREDEGYFWACARVRDLEHLLGEGFNPQLPIRLTESNFVPLFGGDIPDAHPAVEQFMRAA